MEEPEEEPSCGSWIHVIGLNLVTMVLCTCGSFLCGSGDKIEVFNEDKLVHLGYAHFLKVLRIVSLM